MAKAKTRTFRMRPLDEWALAQAREALGENADNTAALQLLVDLGLEAVPAAHHRRPSGTGEGGGGEGGHAAGKEM